ncbi:hypothetical protein LTR05_001481 [Lithohypha guttulata]|uniref:Hydroxyquinol 1,2-dioxygenase n=1 Tax=Lithohypha guttulata TaxID=1690604 RepID=A0AAN7T6N0_9EURO|nr:hypothetical protein LTR05_001481 [Lithohypha guttulata]
MDPSKISLPELKNLTTDNITDNVHLINTHNNPSPRLSYILDRLVTHLHDFARETRLSTGEWMAGIQFLTQTGQICTDVRQEFILLSDILGLSLLVDSMDHPKPTNLGVTEGTVLGPFHTHEAEHMGFGSNMSQDTEGEPLLVICTVKDTKGNPIEGIKIDIWETDSTGHYDVQRPEVNHGKPDGRCVMTSDKEGNFWFKGIVPVSYPIPHDGPVGKLLVKLGRHPWRPAHMHFMFEGEGWDRLITALYVRGDPYETTDAVFGVKDSLIVDINTVTDEAMAKQYDVKVGSKLLTYDFVLVSEQESSALRNERAKAALEKLGRRVKIVEGLPVPDVD